VATAKSHEFFSPRQKNFSEIARPGFVSSVASFLILKKYLPRCPGAVVRRGLLIVTLLAAGIAAAAESMKKKFNLKAGAAGETLKQFAAQTGLEIVFAPEAVGTVATMAVQGEHSPREALDFMLAGTDLVASQDTKTGALAVRRKEVTPRKKVAARADSTPVARIATETAPGADERIEMSPFVVSSDKDNGYQATATLAGTRLNTPVRDVGASISIYTKDFLDDIGATSSSDLLIYATGMEAAGSGGNFSAAGNGGTFSGGAFATNDINAAQVTGDDARVNPQGGSRTRGLAAPSFTRGFFNTDVAFDSYNTESVTAIRGPNAALFGVGSPAGAIDTSLLRPDLRRDRNKVELRYGNNDSLRLAVDFNRVLMDRKLALRIAALQDREKFNQRPAFEKKERIYGALTFEPFKSTSLRGNFESGNTRANRPITVLPYNSISPQWYAAGRPGFDWTFYDDPARNPNAAAQNAANSEGFLMGPGQVLGHLVMVYANPADRTPTLGFLGVTPSTTANVANAVKSQVPNPLVNRDLAVDDIRFIGTRNISEFPAAYWTGANVLPGQLSGLSPAGIKAQGFTDFGAFDFTNRMLDESSRQRESFHTFNLSFEQRGWENRVGIELAYDRQRVDRRSKDAFFSTSVNSQIRIDTNITLPTGQANPNFGRPFAVSGQYPWNNTYRDRETKRVTSFLKYDFKDLGVSWGKWLGRHTITSLYEDTAVDLIGYTYKLATDGAAARANSPNINLDPRRPRAIIYLGPSLIGNNHPLQLQPIQIPEFAAGPTVPVRYLARAANATDPGTFVDAPTSIVEVFNTGIAQRDVTKSQAAVLQSTWLREHLVTMLGWRRDENYFARNVLAFQPNVADLNDPGKVHYGFNDFSFPATPPPNVAKEIKSFSAVARWPEKLRKLPAGAELSAFYNQSANFTPEGGRVDFYGRTQGSPQGKTREYGISLAMFNDRLSVRVNRFQTSVDGVTYTPTVFTSAVNQVTGVPGTWALEGNINPQMVAQSNTEIELLFSGLPANFRQVQQWQVTGTAPTLAFFRTALPGIGDTTDFTAKGLEIEVVCNPTRNWRIMANVAQQETVKSNSLPVLREFIAHMTPVWNKLRNRPVGNYPLGFQPGDILPATVRTYGDNIDTNVLVPFATEMATQGQASPEQRKWRANLVTRYALGHGSIFAERLKGWAVGGAVRWQDRLGIGYPTSRNPDTSVTIDRAHPYYAPPQTNVDAFMSFERKLWHGRLNWKLQLNVRNLYGDSTPIAVSVQPWGEVSTARLAPERRWYLTNTFTF